MNVATLYADYLTYAADVLNFSSSTIRSYRYFLDLYVAHLGDRDVQDIELKEVDDYFAGRKRQGFKPTTLNWERCIIRSFFMYIDRYRQIRLKFDYSMIRRIKAGKPSVKFATMDNLKEMLDALPDPQDRLILTMMFCCGLRISEVCNFIVDNFHDTEIIITGKGKKDRVIPLTSELSEALEEHIRDNCYRTGPVFRHKIRGRGAGKFTVSGLRKRFQRQLGDLYMNPHSLRHGGATVLLDGGMNLRQLQVFLGHEHLSSTEVYTHVTNPGLRAAFHSSFPEVSLLR